MSTTIAVHRLTQADLAALATGRGGPSALRVLQAGQLGKHMLLLREVVRTAEALGGDEAGAARRSYNVIAAAEAREPVITRRVLAYPPIGSWGVNCLAGLRAGVPAGEAGLAHLAAIGAVVALRVGIACELRVPAPGGRAVLPTLGVALVPAEHATVRVTAEAAAVHGGGACVPVPDRPELDAPGWQGLRRLSAEHAGVRLEVSLDDLDPFRDSEGRIGLLAIRRRGRRSDLRCHEPRRGTPRRWRAGCAAWSRCGRSSRGAVSRPRPGTRSARCS